MPDVPFGKRANRAALSDRLLRLGRGNGETSGGSAPPPWTPAALTGLRLLLDASSITAASGDPLAVWPDTSGLGRDAGQATTAKRPVLSSLGSGGAAVLFDGVDDLLTLASAASLNELANTTFSAVFVFASPGGTYPTICSKGPNTDNAFWLLLEGGTGKLHRWSDGAVSGGSLSDGNAHLVFYTWSGTAGTRTETLQCDGGTIVTKTGCADAGSTSDVFAIGNNTISAFPWIGKIALLGFADHAWTTAEKAALTAYCAGKWGTTP